jgi:eukaryotic-like serine/threonine-protein kinase
MRVDDVNGYSIVGEIGSGGMSIVYLARDRRTGRDVVVKRLKDEFSNDSEFVSRFRQAADIMRQLEHPHLARAIDYVEENGNCMLVEEYLPGGSLSDLIDRHEEISEKDALIWCRDSLRAVDYAHRHGVVHRDLKPGNLMFDGDRSIKVTDFGIAKAFGGPRLTRTRAEMGTPAYMSPEQIRQPATVYHLTDVYSMGIVLYELLTRTVPFEKDSDFDTKEAVVKDPPPPPRRFNPEISLELEKIILKAIHKNPERRFGGCAEFATHLDSYLKGTPIKSGGIKQWIREHPWQTALIFVGLFIVIVLAANS